MTTRTKLDILDSRHSGVDRMPTPWTSPPVGTERRRDTYAENLIGSGNYKDSGCEYAPSCLDCPFSECIVANAEAKRAERNAMIWADYKVLRRRRVPSSANPVIEELSERYGLSIRSIHRVLRNARQGKGITTSGPEKPRPESAHEFLTSGIFKQRAPWPELQVGY